jgi:hypothetical protein
MYFVSRYNSEPMSCISNFTTNDLCLHKNLILHPLIYFSTWKCELYLSELLAHQALTKVNAAEIAVSEVDKKFIGHLNDNSTEHNMLLRYSEIRGVFVKYNTMLPSLAPV